MRLLRAGFAAALILVGLAPAVALAQTPLQITTPYPSVVADPGATTKFTVTVTTETPERVDLSVGQQPQGWTTNLHGGGSTISAVFTEATPIASGQTATTASAQFEVDVVIPTDAAAGDDKVIINGHSASGQSASLELDVAIQPVGSGAITFTANYPQLQGSASTKFSFNLQLKNDTNQQIAFSFEVDAPSGWTTTAEPATQSQAATTTIDAGSSQTIAVTAQPPSTAAADTYPITVRALGGPQPVEQQLSVTVTGSYSMTVNTSDSRLNASVSAGGTTALTLVVDNTGTAPLTNVAMTSTPPQGWKVTFDQDTIAQIDPGATQNVQATIQAASNAVTGDYVVTFLARNDQTNDSVQIRTTVETSPLGGLIGIAVLVVVAVGLFFVFQRYGRR